MENSYYDVLGVDTLASNADIRRAYYALARKLHPNVSGNFSLVFVRINEAYIVLSDKRIRALHDAWLYERKEGGIEGFANLLEEMVRVINDNREAGTEIEAGGSKGVSDKQIRLKKFSPNIEFNSYYDVLGVDTQASREEIQGAYLTLVKKLYPEESGNPSLAKQIFQINEAYAVLSDKRKRALHDAWLYELSDKEDGVEGFVNLVQETVRFIKDNRKELYNVLHGKDTSRRVDYVGRVNRGQGVYSDPAECCGVPQLRKLNQKPYKKKQDGSIGKENEDIPESSTSRGEFTFNMERGGGGRRMDVIIHIPKDIGQNVKEEKTDGMGFNIGQVLGLFVGPQFALAAAASKVPCNWWIFAPLLISLAMGYFFFLHLLDDGFSVPRSKWPLKKRIVFFAMFFSLWLIWGVVLCIIALAPCYGPHLELLPPHL